jgi:hypothetical protein
MPEMIPVGTVVLTHIYATDGTNGILLEIHPHPGLKLKTFSRYAMTEEQARDLSQTLAKIVALPRDKMGPG